MVTAFVLSVLFFDTKPLDAVNPLIGSWTGTSEGASGKASVTRTYGSVFGGKYVRFETVAKFPSKNGKPGEVHRDIGFFSADQNAKALALREFHIEGFVNTYSQVPGTAKKLVFETREIENLGKGWRARTTIALTSSSTIVEEFSIAEPTKDFELYSTVSLKRSKSR